MVSPHVVLNPVVVPVPKLIPRLALLRAQSGQRITYRPLTFVRVADRGLRTRIHSSSIVVSKLNGGYRDTLELLGSRLTRFCDS